MELADDSKLPGIEGDRTLATAEALSQAIPGFALTAHDCAKLTEILIGYAPYKAGQTALFWHIVGIIGEARKPADPEQELGRIVCDVCHGNGFVPVDVGVGNWNTNDCPECDGVGYFPEDEPPVWRCQNMAHKRYLMFQRLECSPVPAEKGCDYCGSLDVNPKCPACQGIER